MNIRQRHVVVVSLGLAPGVAAWTTIRVFDDGGDARSFMYTVNTSPNATGLVYGPDQWWLIRDGLVWISAVAVWFVLAFWLYRDAGRDRPVDTAGP